MNDANSRGAASAANGEAVSNAQRLSFIGNVSDGEELMGYLNGTGDYADRVRYPVPDLLLLDLKMPRKNGFEVCFASSSLSFAACPANAASVARLCHSFGSFFRSYSSAPFDAPSPHSVYRQSSV